MKIYLVYFPTGIGSLSKKYLSTESGRAVPLLFSDLLLLSKELGLGPVYFIKEK